MIAGDIVTTLMKTVLDAHDAGLSIIPIKSDGSKKPPFAWKAYQSERATKEQLRAWFAPGMFEAAAVVCGEVSGWLHMIEMEGWAFEQGLWPAFREQAVAALGEERWTEITRYVEHSPSGGVHFYVRCPGFGEGNLKLAMLDGLVVIETRGEGGYSIIAPSVGHNTGLPWTVAQGVLSDIATVSLDEMAVILAAARTLDGGGEDPSSATQPADANLPAPVESQASASKLENRLVESKSGWMDATIADFNDSASVLAWLPGWTFVRDDIFEGEPIQRYKRDGSDNEHGMAIMQSGRVGFFSSNCPAWAQPYDGRKFETYDAFTVHMFEDCGGNSQPARVAEALRLRGEGFGPPLTPVPEPTPDSVTVTELAPAEGDGEGESEHQSPDAEVAPTLRLRWVEDALADMPPEPEPIVTNLLRRGEVTVLGAPRAIGKTWASLNLATILATGRGELFGNPAFRPAGPRKVLYLQGELGEWGSATRWEMTAEQHLRSTFPAGMVAETFERIRIRTTHRKVTSVADGTVFEDTHVDAVMDHRLEPAVAGFDLLVIDPWATFFAGKENDNDETEAAILALTDIARRNDIAVWIVHHISAKTQHSTLAEPEDLWRGASRLADAVATRVTVLPHYEPKKAKELGLDRSDARRFIDVHVLERNGPPVPMWHAQREGVWWNAWEPPKTGRPSELSQQEVVTKLRQAPGQMVSSKRQLCDLLNKSHGVVDRVLPGMIELGMVETIAGSRGAVGYRLVGEP